MKVTVAFIAMMVTTFFIGTSSNVAKAQSTEKEVSFASRNMGGPRLGVTVIPGNNSTTKKMQDRGIGRMISQFGWHFEQQIIPEGGGPSFVIQETPLVGGVEYGVLLPSFTLAMGVRLPNGIEFGMGPNLLVTPQEASSSLILAIGKSYNYGGVSIPLNLAVATNKDGARLSFVFGYAIDKGLK